MKCILIVYNPRSSRFADVEREVITEARAIKGCLVGKYEVKPTSIEQNIANLSKLIQDGDLVISAGGDATGVVAAGGIMKSEKDATLAALPYGNFNDLARTLGTKSLQDVLRAAAKPKQFYPLEILVDGQFFRYATCYVTIGMTAEATAIYDAPKLRHRLKTSPARNIVSYIALAIWYFRNRHKHTFIPEFILNQSTQPPRTSDYIATNGTSMARIMKGYSDYRHSRTFHSQSARLASIPHLAKFMFQSIFRNIPSNPTTGDTITFTHPATVTMQAEGELRTFKHIRQIEIKKSNRAIKVAQC